MDSRSLPPSKERLEANEAVENKESLLSLGAGAESLETDQNREALLKMHRLEGMLEPEKQMEGITVLMAAITSVIAETKRQGGDMERVGQNPYGLFAEVNRLNLAPKLDSTQRASLDILTRLMREKGPTMNYIAQSWGEYAEEGNAAGGNAAEKLWHQAKEHPVRSVAIATAVGIGAWAIYKWMSSDDEVEAEKGSEETSKEKDGSNKIFTKRNVLGAAFVVSLLTGIDATKRLKEFWAMFNVAGDAKEKVEELKKKVEEHVKKGEAIPDDLQKEIQETVTKAEEAKIEGKEEHREKLAEIRKDVEENSGTVTEELEANRYHIAKNLFVEMYFYQREFFGTEKKNEIKAAVDALSDVPVGEVVAVFEKYKDKGEVPKGSLKGLPDGLSEKHIFQMVQGIVRLNGFVKSKEDISVRELFEQAAGNSVISKAKHFGEKVKEAVASGDLTALPTALLSMETPFGTKDMEALGEEISQTLGIDLGSLNAEEKRVFVRIQATLLAQGNLKDNAQETVANLSVEGKEQHPRAAEMAVRFFEKVKEGTATLLPQLHERFGIETGDNNWLKEGVTLENINLSHAAQLLTISGRGEPHWSKDLMILNILLHSFSDKNAKNQYMASIVDSLTNDVEVPEGLKLLKPYLESAVEVGINGFFGKGLDALEWAHGMVGNHASTREDFAELAKESPFISFGKEAAGTGLEMGMDSAAILLGLLGVTKEELASMADGQGEEFLELLVSRGGDIGYDRNSGIMIIHAIGKYFVARPGKILAETFGSLADGDFSGAAKVWAVGSAPFVTIGAASGFFVGGKAGADGVVRHIFKTKVTEILKGGLKGLAYPYYAPKAMIQGGKAVLRGGKAVIDGGKTVVNAGASIPLGAKELAGRPGRAVGETLRWTSDLWKYPGFRDLNMTSLMTDGHLMDYYSEASKFSEKGLDGYLQEAMYDRATLARRLGSRFNEKMAIRYGERFAERYNRIFVEHALSLEDIRAGKMEKCTNAYKLMGRVMRNLSGNQSVVDDIIKSAATYADSVGIDELAQKLEKLGFPHEESLALAQQMRSKKNALAMMERLREGGEHLKQANTAIQATETTAQAAIRVADATEDVSSAATLGRGAKALRVLGQAVGVVGVAFSAYQTASSAHEALTSNVEGRAAIEGGRAAMWGLDTAVGVAATAGAFGVKGALVGAASYAALPLVPITYMGNAAFDTLKETNMTTAEWIQKYPHQQLLHEWVSNFWSVSVGDVGVGIGSFSLEYQEKTESIHKLYKILVAVQKNPEILRYLQEGEPSEEKNAQLEGMIEAAYSPYLEYYFNQVKLDIKGIKGADEARQVIADAIIFDELMLKREQKIASGQEEMMIGTANLLDDEFSVDANGNGKELGYRLKIIVDEYKKMVTEHIGKTASPEVLSNLESMDTAYLLRLYVQMNRVTSGREEVKDESVRRAFMSSMIMIRNYLICARSLDFETAVRANGKLYEQEMSTDELLRNLEAFGDAHAKPYEEYEEKLTENRPEIHALYRLAEHLGYAGDRNEADLKTFFNEGAASHQGLYWNGEEWYLQERGMEMDDSLGGKMTEAAVRKAVRLMKDNPDDILEHRSDTMFLDALDFSKPVLAMADVLEKGLEEGIQKNQREPTKKEASQELAMATQ